MKKRGRLKFHKIKTWQLLILLVPLLFIDATLLRLDHIKMAELREAVLMADEAEEEDAVIAEKLTALKEFTFSNIVVNVVDDNGAQKVTFGTGPFYLEHTYIRAANRALAEAEERFADDSNPNGNIYAAASATCKALAIQNGWTWDNANYINCMVGEIQKYPAADNIESQIAASLPSTELYRHNYASPIWAPTATGWMILLSAVIVIVLLVRGLIWIFLRISLLFV